MAYRLVWYPTKGRTSGRERRVAVSKNGPLTVGRDQTNAIVVNESAVSRVHARIEVADDRVVVSDEGSHNGTFLDGKTIKRSVWRPGQKLTVGGHTIELEKFTPRLDGDYRPLEDRAAVARMLLAICACLTLLDFIFTTGQFWYISSYGYSPTFRLLLALNTLLFVCVYLGAVVAFAMWQYRATDNLRSFGLRDLEFSPVAAIIWWFVPVANLLQPMRAVSELWLASNPLATDKRLRRQHAPGPVVWWWVTWLTGSLAIPVLALVIFIVVAINPLALAQTFFLVLIVILVLLSKVILMLSMLLGVKIVNRITRLQDERTGAQPQSFETRVVQ